MCRETLEGLFALSMEVVRYRAYSEHWREPDALSPDQDPMPCLQWKDMKCSFLRCVGTTTDPPNWSGRRCGALVVQVVPQSSPHGDRPKVLTSRYRVRLDPSIAGKMIALKYQFVELVFITGPNEQRCGCNHGLSFGKYATAVCTN